MWRVWAIIVVCLGIGQTLVTSYMWHELEMTRIELHLREDNRKMHLQYEDVLRKYCKNQERVADACAGSLVSVLKRLGMQGSVVDEFLVGYAQDSKDKKSEELSKAMGGIIEP